MVFETLALKGNLTTLSELPTVDARSLSKIMSSMADLDVAHYYQVAKNRWTVLRQVERLVDRNEKVKVLARQNIQKSVADGRFLGKSDTRCPQGEKVH